MACLTILCGNSLCLIEARGENTTAPEISSAAISGTPARPWATLEVGVAGFWQPGIWAPCRLSSSDLLPETTSVQLATPDVDGSPVSLRLAREASLSGDGPVLWSGFIKLASPSAAITISQLDETGKLLRTDRIEAGFAPGFQSGHGLEERLVATIGLPESTRNMLNQLKGMAASRTRGPLHVVHLETPAELPQDLAGWSAIDYLLVGGTATFKDAESQKLKAWVETGGTLWTSLQLVTDAEAKDLSPEARLALVSRGLASWLPVDLTTEVSIVRELGSLEKLAQSDKRIPQSGRISLPRFRMRQGELLAASRGDQLLVRSAYGLGVVTILALDPAKTPLQNWEAQPRLWQQLAAESVTRSESSLEASRQLVSTGVTDLATQLSGVVETFPGVQRITPGLLMATLLAIVLLVGPIDYLIVHRLLKRPALTWITFPAMVVLLVMGMSLWAAKTNGIEATSQTISLVDLDPVAQVGRTFSLHAIYGAEPNRLVVKAKSLWPEKERVTGSEDDLPLLSWWAPPEGSLGGLLRPGGTFFPAAPYELEPQKSMLNGLPVEHWGTRLLQSESRYRIPEPLFETNLETNGLGKLTGTIRHKLPMAITDWVLVHGNRLYRWLDRGDEERIVPLEANFVWRVDQPGITQRELRGFMTGARARTVKGDASGAGGTIAVEQTAYNALGSQPVDIVRMMSFHEDVGGAGYTGLTSKLISGADLSMQLRLGKAILVGRIAQPATSLEIDADNHLRPSKGSKGPTQTKTGEVITIIRCILPVTSSTGGELAPLPKLNSK
jgi:hypothetical protein